MTLKTKTMTNEEIEHRIREAYEHGKLEGEKNCLTSILFKLLKIEDKKQEIGAW